MRNGRGHLRVSPSAHGPRSTPASKTDWRRRDGGGHSDGAWCTGGLNAGRMQVASLCSAVPDCRCTYEHLLGKHPGTRDGDLKVSPALEVGPPYHIARESAQSVCLSTGPTVLRTTRQDRIEDCVLRDEEGRGLIRAWQGVRARRRCSRASRPNAP